MRQDFSWALARSPEPRSRALSPVSVPLRSGLVLALVRHTHVVTAPGAALIGQEQRPCRQLIHHADGTGRDTAPAVAAP